MKKYKDYVFESVSHPDFEKDFDVIIEDLDKFWRKLDYSLDLITDFNSGKYHEDEKKKQKQQQKQQKQKPTPPEKMRNGVLLQYSYVTNSGRTTVVTIDTPDNGMNTDTALVKPANNPGSKTYPVKWSRLTPFVPVSTT